MASDATQELTVIIPTRNRQAALARTLGELLPVMREVEAAEVIVVDDGSAPPVILPGLASRRDARVLRLAGVGRSMARNAGAAAARSGLLVFVDDDMTVQPGFARAHRGAHEASSNLLCVGSVRLSPETAGTPFGRFRQALEDGIVDQVRSGSVPGNFCTAQNMSLAREDWQRLGGFDPELQSSEDQDLALRHVSKGGRILFVPEAVAIHRDSVAGIRDYVRRTEWGAEHNVPFCRKHPELPDNVERERVNGETLWGREPVSLSLKKSMKVVLGLRPLMPSLLWLTVFLEHAGPESTLLARCYRVLLGVSLLKGHRAGLRAYGGRP